MTINNTNGMTSGSATTSTATESTFATHFLEDDCAALVRVRVVARESSTGRIAAWEMLCAAKRNGGGAAIVGDVELTFHKSDAATSLWFATVQAAGDNLVIEVKGEAGKTIDWSGQIDTREMYIT